MVVKWSYCARPNYVDIVTPQHCHYITCKLLLKMSRLTRNIQYLIIVWSLIMHTLFGITLILHMLKLSACKGFISMFPCSFSLKKKRQPNLTPCINNEVKVNVLLFYFTKSLSISSTFSQTISRKQGYQIFIISYYTWMTSIWRQVVWISNKAGAHN